FPQSAIDNRHLALHGGLTHLWFSPGSSAGGHMYISRTLFYLAYSTLAILFVPACAMADTLFLPAQTYPLGALGSAGANGIVVADINGDGKPDVIVASACNAHNCDGTIDVLLGNGDGTFQPVKNIDSGLTFLSSVAVADVNGDGKPDLAVATGASCSPVPCQ